MKPNIEHFEPPIEVRTDHLMKLSGVVNKFMDVKRATLRQGAPETDGEHTLHLQFIAVAYAAQYHANLNVGKVSLYSLVHDFVEVYAGDVNSLQAELGDTWPDFIELIRLYEELEEPEARFVKSFDKLDPSFSHYSNGGDALMRMGVITREEYNDLCQRVYERIIKYADEFPDVIAIRQELIERIARVAYPTV
jgi:5'-deoxynucleotidase YfbR-like HD superfamily hydrolase